MTGFNKEFLHKSAVGDYWVECKIIFETEFDYYIMHQDPFNFTYKEAFVSKDRVR